MNSTRLSRPYNSSSRNLRSIGDSGGGGCRRLLAALAILLLGLETAAAQEPPATASPPPVDRTILVPYRDLDELLKGQAASAIVPYEAYLKFLQHTSGGEVKPPVSAVLVESHYRAVVEADLARITAEYKVRVLGKPWVELPLAFGDAAVGKITAPEAEVLLRGTGDGTYTLLLGTAGEYTVTVELMTRVRGTPDGREFTLAIPPVGITTFDVSVPEADQTVVIEPRLVALPADAADGATRVKANLGSTRSVTARWRPRASLQPQMELLAGVETKQLVTLDGGLVHHDAWLTWNVLRGNLSTLKIAVPPGARVLDVSADKGIKSWSAKEEDRRQVLTVELLAPAAGTVKVEVHTEAPLAESTLAVAGVDAAGVVRGIQAMDAVRESGQVAVRAGADVELAVTDQQGVTRLAAEGVPPELRPGAATAFRYYSPDFRLAVATRPIEPRVLVTQDTQLTFDDNELRLSASLKYQVERAGVFELSLLVPADVVIDDVQSPQMESEAFDAATRILTIRLRKRTTGEIPITIKAHRPLATDSQTGSLDLPILEPQSVARETGTVRVFAPPSLEVVTSEDGVQSAQPAPASAGQKDGEAVLTSVWSYSRRPVRIPVTTTRKPTRLSTTIATTIDVQPETTEVTTLVDYRVEFAGIDTFVVQIPEAATGTVQIESEPVGSSAIGIKQKTAGTAANGFVPWTIVLQRDVVGTQRFRITYRLAGGEAAEGEAAEQPIAIPLIRPQGKPAEGNGAAAVPVTSLRGEVRVLKERSLSVSGSAEGGDLEAIDLRELTLLPHEGALAFRYFRQPDDAALAVSLSRTKHEIQEVVPTVIEKALIEIAAVRHSAATYRCRYRIRTVERQRLRIDLPKGMEVLGMFIDGNQQQLNPVDPGTANDVAEDADAYQFNIVRNAKSDETFLLTLQFTWNVNPLPFESPFGRGSVLFPLPRIGGSGSPAHVQELRVEVFTPERYWLVGAPDRFSILGKPTWLDGLQGSPSPRRMSNGDWIGDSASLLQFPTEGLRGTTYASLGRTPEIEVVWWDTVKMTLLFGIAIGLIAYILLRTSWENKLSILLLLALIAMLIGVRDPDALAHGLAAARFGLLFLVLLWLIHGLFARSETPAASGPSLPPGWSPATEPAVPPSPGPASSDDKSSA